MVLYIGADKTGGKVFEAQKILGEQKLHHMRSTVGFENGRGTRGITELPRLVFEAPAPWVCGIDQHITILFGVFIQPLFEALIGSPSPELVGIQHPALDLLVPIDNVDVRAPMVTAGPWDGGILDD